MYNIRFEVVGHGFKSSPNVGGGHKTQSFNLLLRRKNRRKKTVLRVGGTLTTVWTMGPDKPKKRRQDNELCETSKILPETWYGGSRRWEETEG